MSGLEELRAGKAAEDAVEVEETTLEVEAEIEEAEPAPVEEETEEVDEIDFHLEGEEPQASKYTPEQSLVHKLTKAKKQRKEAVSEVEELKRTVEALQAQMTQAPQVQAQPQMAQVPAYTPKAPELYDADIGGDRAKYDAAMYRYTQGSYQLMQQQSQAEVQQTQQAAAHEKAQNERALKLAERSTSFIQSNKVKPEAATNAIQAGVSGLDEALGVEGSALGILEMIGEGSEKLAYYLGKNSEALNTVKQLIAKDPNGLSAVTWLTKTAGKLTRKNQHISKAPTPDEPLTGDGSSATAAKLQSEYDKENDVSKLVKMRQKARDIGITLS